MPRNETLVGEYLRENQVFQDESPEDRFVIGDIAASTAVNTVATVTVKGKAVRGSLDPGNTYRFWGHWEKHPRYGEQFRFSSHAIATPISQRGLEHYIAQARGIGRKRAREIVEVFGQDSLAAIRDTPEKVANCIAGLSVGYVKRAAELFARDARQEELLAELMGLLAGRHFPHTLPVRCINRWGARAAEIIRENPYVLVTFHGAGFLTADRLYMELGLDPTAIIRQGMCLWYAVHSDNEGHIWFSVAHTNRFLRQNLSADLDPQQALAWAIENDLLVSREQDGQTWIADAKLAAHEANIVNCLWAAEGEKPQWLEIFGTEAEDDGAPSLHQAKEINLALQGKIGVLTGGPGTGKTFALAAVIKQIECGENRIAVCAPTGKAAVRVTESLAAQGVEIVARTIHSTLGVESSDGGWSFTYTASNPLPYDFIFVDEVSMQDVPLMSALLAARGGAHVLFVGDQNQLSPVGPGAPFRDKIAAGVPCGQLIETRRHAGQTIETQRLMRKEGRIEWSDELDIEAGKNFIHCECETPEEQIEELFRLFADETLVEAFCQTKQDYLDPIWDVQVIAAVNKKSPLGRVPLNEMLQARLNPTGKQAKGNPFRVGDKIICTKNGDVTWLDSPGGKSDKTRVANGEQARVVDVTASMITAQLSSPDRLIRIPKGKQKEDGGTGCPWELAYAITSHKSQGSEWPVVLILLDSYPGAVRLCDVHWLITATSRHSLYGVTIGRKSLARAMCKRSALWQRKTFMREDLEELRLRDMVEFFTQSIQGDQNGEEEGSEKSNEKGSDESPSDARTEGTQRHAGIGDSQGEPAATGMG